MHESPHQGRWLKDLGVREVMTVGFSIRWDLPSPHLSHRLAPESDLLGHPPNLMLDRTGSGLQNHHMATPRQQTADRRIIERMKHSEVQDGKFPGDAQEAGQVTERPVRGPHRDESGRHRFPR